MHVKFLRVCASVAILFVLIFACRGDESPGFFLKITKNVPRLGKRAEDSYFMKNMKSIPRIGRSGDEPTDLSDLLSWLWGTPLTQPNKRRLDTPTSTGVERELSVVQPVNSNTLIELLDRDAIPSEHVKFVHWKDFDRALLSDAELYNKVISLGRKPDQRLKQDISFNSFIPIFGNDNDGNGGDFMLYNKNDRELYGNDRFQHDFLQYNRLQ